MHRNPRRIALSAIALAVLAFASAASARQAAAPIAHTGATGFPIRVLSIGTTAPLAGIEPAFAHSVTKPIAPHRKTPVN